MAFKVIYFIKINLISIENSIYCIWDHTISTVDRPAFYCLQYLMLDRFLFYFKWDTSCWLIDWFIVGVYCPSSNISTIFRRWKWNGWQKWTWHDDEMKNRMWHMDNEVDKFWSPLKIGKGGRIGQFSLLWRSPMVPTMEEYHKRVLYHARNMPFFLTRCTTMVCCKVKMLEM